MSYVTIKYEYLHQTDDAVLVICPEKIWIPKNCIKDGHELNFEDDYELNFEMKVAEWFAIKKDLV